MIIKVFDYDMIIILSFIYNNRYIRVVHGTYPARSNLRVIPRDGGLRTSNLFGK